MKHIIMLLSLLMLSPLYGQTMNMDYLQMSGQAESAAIDEICQRYNLYCTASGGGAMDVVRTSHFTVNTKRKFDIAEARRIVVCGMLIFANYIDSYRELRPFLIEYPFPMDELGVSLMCDSNLDDSSSNPDRLSSASAIAGKIFYSQSLPPLGKLITIYEEPFEEALKIVQRDYPEAIQEIAQKISIPQKKKSFFWKIGSFVTSKLFGFDSGYKEEKYVGPPLHRQTMWNLDAYGQEIAKKYGMIFHREGNPSTVRYVKVRYGLDLFDDHMKTLEEGRIFAAELAKDFMHHLNTTPIIDEYHKNTNENLAKRKTHPPLTPHPVPEQTCLRIGYWDTNFDRPKEPLLAQILLSEGYFHYYIAEPTTQALKLVYKESYNDAMQFLQGQQKSS